MDNIQFQKLTNTESLAARLLKESYSLADDYKAKGHVPLALAIEQEADRDFDSWCLQRRGNELVAAD